MQTHESQLTPGQRVLRFVAGFVGAVGFGFGAFVLLFMGIVTATGCFFECSEPDLLVGIPLLAGAVAAAAAAVTSLVWGSVGGSARWLGRVFLGSAVAGMFILVIGSLF